MKHLIWGSLFALALAGCGKGATVSNSDGDKVSLNPTTGDMTITDKDGKTTEIEGKGDSWTAKSSDGTELKFEDGKMTGKTETGETFEAGLIKVTEAELGLPFYPGSKQVEHGSSKSEAAGQAMYSLNRSTRDMPDKVIAFYKDKFIDAQTFSSSDDGALQAQVSGKLKDGAEGAVIALREKGSSDTKIMISMARKKSK